MERISDYDTFFDNYEKTGISYITNVVEILKTFQNYLDSIYLKINNFRSLKISANYSITSSVKGKMQINYNDIIETLKKYMNIIYNYYDKISISELSSNIDINYHFIDTMTTAIIILYSYIYFYNISEIDEHKNETYFKYNNSTITFIMHRIIKHCYTIVDVPNNDKLLFKFKDIIYNNEPRCRKFINNQTFYISNFIQKIRKFNDIKPSNKRYVTIPKYTGICWFISFIVGICYSDRNKKLLLEKFSYNRDNYKKDEDISSLSGIEIFTTLIYKIIYEITLEKKTYDDIDENTMNELNIYLKETPLKFLIKILSEYYENDKKEDYPPEYSFIKKYIDDKNKEIIDNDIKTQFEHFNKLIINADKDVIDNVIADIIKLKQKYKYTTNNFNKLFDEKYIDLFDLYNSNSKDDDNDNDNEEMQKENNQRIVNTTFKPLLLDEFQKITSWGIDAYNYFFLNMLYKFLNINSLYLIKCENNNFYSYDINNNDPDIILINVSSNYYCELFRLLHRDQKGKSISFTDITSKITYEPDIITYNNNKYEIDYILYGSDQINSWKNTGHAIVALNYDNEDYFYDSRYYINEYTYKNKTLRYPCPLLKKDWKTDYKLSSSKFCLKKCFHTYIDHKSELYKDAKNLTEDDICFTANNDVICCYVKIKEGDIINGGNKKLKSTNKKITFVIDNKKIKRTIYINDKGISFIKFNNKFIKVI